MKLSWSSNDDQSLWKDFDNGSRWNRTVSIAKYNSPDSVSNTFFINRPRMRFFKIILTETEDSRLKLTSDNVSLASKFALLNLIQKKTLHKAHAEGIFDKTCR